MITATVARTTAFPAATIEVKLRNCLLELAASVMAIREQQMPVSISQQYAVSIQLDSLDVVDLLCDVEPVLGFELKDSIVKSGGYGSINKAIGHLMPQIEAAWNKNARKGSRK
jgi:acyl carrier protein